MLFEVCFPPALVHAVMLMESAALTNSFFLIREIKLQPCLCLEKDHFPAACLSAMTSFPSVCETSLLKE